MDHPDFDVCAACGERAARCRAWPGGCEHRQLTRPRRMAALDAAMARLDYDAKVQFLRQINERHATHEHVEPELGFRAMLMYAAEYDVGLSVVWIRPCIDSQRCVLVGSHHGPRRRFHVDALVLVEEP